jgi:hypothetical protein
MSYALIRGRWMRLPSPPVWVGWGLFWAVIAYWLGRTVIDLWARFGA